MTAPFNVNLFLTNEEREQILKLHDTLYELDYSTEEQLMQGHKWCKILSRLVFGKTLTDTVHYPLLLRKKNESTD